MRREQRNKSKEQEKIMLFEKKKEEWSFAII
jgi:hypothetical protein